MSALEEARKITDFTSALYPDIPFLRSAEVIQMQKNNDDFVLVDIRAQDERDWSIIPGSVALDVFENQMIPALNRETRVIVQCAWGFRSGYEARRLRNRYGLINVCHMDGIVSFTHAEGARLVEPLTQKDTENVHVIRSDWGHVGKGFVAQSFGRLEYYVRDPIITATFLFRRLQNWIHIMRFGPPPSIKQA